MSQSNRRRRDEIEVEGTPQITLGDLRWLVAEAEGLADASPVDVTAYRELGQRDHDPARIVVKGIRRAAAFPTRAPVDVVVPGRRWDTE
jgi:hypothetical protein